MWLDVCGWENTREKKKWKESETAGKGKKSNKKNIENIN